LAAQNHRTKFGSLRNAHLMRVKAGCAAHARNYFRSSALKCWRAVVSNHSPHPSIAEVTAAFLWKSAMKTVRFEANHEGTKALALAVGGVMVAMLMWYLMMLLFY
jgi:hypothetical protein